MIDERKFDNSKRRSLSSAQSNGLYDTGLLRPNDIYSPRSKEQSFLYDPIMSIIKNLSPRFKNRTAIILSKALLPVPVSPDMIKCGTVPSKKSRYTGSHVLESPIMPGFCVPSQAPVAGTICAKKWEGSLNVRDRWFLLSRAA